MPNYESTAYGMWYCIYVVGGLTADVMAQNLVRYVLQSGNPAQELVSPHVHTWSCFSRATIGG